MTPLEAEAVTRWTRPLGQEAVRSRSQGVCELHSEHPGDSFSHRKPKSLGGGWELPNGLRACGDGTRLGHGYIEANPTKAERLGWRVPSWQNPATIPCFIWADPYRAGWYLLTDNGLYVWADDDEVRAAGLDPDHGIDMETTWV